MNWEKSIKLNQKKIRAHALDKSNRQKLELKTYTQKKNSNSQTQNDGRKSEPEEYHPRH